MKKWCLFCGAEITFGLASRKFCCDRCRRKYQDRRRLEERREKRIIPLDPWSRCDVDDWTVEEILANALLDPLPAGLVWEDSSIKLKFGNRPSSGRDGLGWDDAGNHEGTMRTGKDNEVTARLARRKARRESRRERRRRLRGSVRKV